MVQQESKLTHLQRKALDFFFTDYTSDCWQYLMNTDWETECHENNRQLLAERYFCEPIENIKSMVQDLYDTLVKVEASGYQRALGEDSDPY